MTRATEIREAPSGSHWYLCAEHAANAARKRWKFVERLAVEVAPECEACEPDCGADQ